MLSGIFIFRGIMQSTYGERYKCFILGFQNSLCSTMAQLDQLSPCLPILIHISKQRKKLSGDKENSIKWVK